MSTVLVAGAAVVGAAATVYSGQQQAKATKNAANAQREATAAQARAASVDSQRDRIQQVREARIRRAQVLAASGNEGIGFGSSGTQGAVGSISTQAAANIGSINQQQTFADEASAALQRAADAQVSAQKWQTIGAIGKSIFDTSVSVGTKKGIF